MLEEGKKSQQCAARPSALPGEIEAFTYSLRFFPLSPSLLLLVVVVVAAKIACTSATHTDYGGARVGQNRKEKRKVESCTKNISLLFSCCSGCTRIIISNENSSSGGEVVDGWSFPSLKVPSHFSFLSG